jgi:sugar/nucleoside kinase (ribokinase family)
VRTGVTVNLIHGSTRTQITYPGTIAAFDGSWIGPELVAGFDHVHMAGPYLQTRFRRRIAGVLEMCRERGLTASLDPQWDPEERWEHMDVWLPLLDTLFVNEAEARSLSRRDSIEEAAAELNRRTACAVVKAGPEGSLVWIDGAVRRVPAASVEVVDTTGAGDTFDAAFLFARLERKLSLEEACRFANRIAGESCRHTGGLGEPEPTPESRPSEDPHPEEPQAVK